MEFLKKIFEEPDGKPSSKRILSALLLVTFMVSYLRTVFTTNTIPDVPSNWTTLIIGILGLLSATTIFTNKVK